MRQMGGKTNVSLGRISSSGRCSTSPTTSETYRSRLPSSYDRGSQPINVVGWVSPAFIVQMLTAERLGFSNIFSTCPGRGALAPLPRGAVLLRDTANVSTRRDKDTDFT